MTELPSYRLLWLPAVSTLCPVKRWNLDFRTCNISSVYHAFHTERHFLSATEYSPARTLKRTIDKGPMNPGPRCFILEYFYFYILTKTGPLLKLDVKVIISDNTFEMRDVSKSWISPLLLRIWRRAKPARDNHKKFCSILNNRRDKYHCYRWEIHITQWR